MSDRRSIPCFGRGLFALLVATIALHVVHAVAGHAWFSVYGPVLGLILALALLCVLRYGDGRPSLGVCSALLVLLVMPEWLEGELTAGHRADSSTLENHGAATILVLGVAVGVAVLWEANRVLTLIRPR